MMNTTVSPASGLQPRIPPTTVATPVIESHDQAPATHPETEQTGVSPFDITRALRLLTSQVFRSLAQQLGASPSVAEDLGFAPPDNPDAAGTQLAGALRGFVGTQSPTPETAAPVVSQQVAVGIEAGYRETVQLLAQKGPIPADVQIRLQQSRELAFAAAADATPTATGNAADIQVAGARAAEATRSRSADITVRTLDGDTITLQISAQSALQVATAAIDNGNEAGVSQQATYSSGLQFNLGIDGNLDRGETKAIRQLFHQVRGILKEFAKADYADAIEKFAQLKLDNAYLANVAIDLSNTRSVAVAGLYAAAATPLPAADPAPPVPSTHTVPVAARTDSAPQTSLPAPAPGPAPSTPVNPAPVGAVNSGPATGNPASATDASPAPGTTVDAQPDIAGLADLLAPFVSLFRGLLGNAQFAEPGRLIAELSAALLDLQSGISGVDAVAGNDTDADADIDAGTGVDTDAAVTTPDNQHASLKKLLRDVLGELDNRQHHDKPEKAVEHDDDSHNRQNTKVSEKQSHE